MILGLIFMILLGLLGAALTLYKRNYFVRVFDDILGREEEERLATEVGRGFFYWFLLPFYFILLVIGLLALIAFLIIAAILAAIVFIMVWVTEKILPQSWIGGVVLSIFSKFGMSGADRAAEPVAETRAPSPVTPPPAEPPAPAPPSPAPASDAPAAPAAPADEGENPFGAEGINRTRRHSLD